MDTLLQLEAVRLPVLVRFIIISLHTTKAETGVSAEDWMEAALMTDITTSSTMLFTTGEDVHVTEAHTKPTL